MKAIRTVFSLVLTLTMVGGTFVLLAPSTPAGSSCGPPCPKISFPTDLSRCDCPGTVVQNGCVLSLFLCAESPEGEPDLCGYCYNGG